MFNESSVFTQRRSGHEQKGTSIGKMGAADRTHLSAETTYVAISRDAPHLKMRNMQGNDSLVSGAHVTCGGAGLGHLGPEEELCRGSHLDLSCISHLHTFFIIFPKENMFSSSFVCLLECSFLKLLSLFLRPSGALILLLSLGLSLILHQIVFQSQVLDHLRYFTLPLPGRTASYLTAAVGFLPCCGEALAESWARSRHSSRSLGSRGLAKAEGRCRG